MAEMNKATVHASERTSARDMIQTSFDDDSDLSLKTEKDAVKMKKKADKDERAARAALAAHQVPLTYKTYLYRCMHVSLLFVLKSVACKGTYADCLVQPNLCMFSLHTY